MSTSLDGQRAFVTGAAGGIGAAVCASLEMSGVVVVRIDRTGSVDVHLDVSDFTAVRSAFAELVNQAALQIVVHCAGIGSLADFEATTAEEWEAVMAVNAGGTFNVLRHGLPLMAAEGYGRFVTVGSIASDFGYRSPAYGASKAAVEALTRSAAVAYAGAGVTVNCIKPGRVNTPLAPVDSADDLSERVPVGRSGTTGELAALVCGLVRPEMSYLTGASIPCDGGVSKVFALHGLGNYSPSSSKFNC
ncbi:MAG: SDR family NAD(P)-dependent oxidoreductase [Acidimicrobiales bacterium]